MGPGIVGSHSRVLAITAGGSWLVCCELRFVSKSLNSDWAK